MVSPMIPKCMQLSTHAFWFQLCDPIKVRALKFCDWFEVAKSRSPYPWLWQSNTSRLRSVRSSCLHSTRMTFKLSLMCYVNSRIHKKYFSHGVLFCQIQTMILSSSWQRQQDANSLSLITSRISKAPSHWGFGQLHQLKH